MSSLESIEERIARVNEKLQTQLFQKKGVKGLRGLRRNFTTADFSGNKMLDKEEFSEAMTYSGLFLKQQEVSLLFQYYDQSGDGNISYDEFISGLAMPISKKPRRHKMVLKVFRMMERTGDGMIDASDVGHLYNAKKHPDVMKGEKSEEQILIQFLKGFEGKKESRTKDGRISLAEFEAYYTELSASIPSDDYFVSMMESVWNIREDGVPDKFEVRMENLLKMLREKVRQKTPVGREEKETLYQTFKFFDRDDSKAVTQDEFKNSLEKYGISLERRDIGAFFNAFDPDGSGTITYREFISRVFNEDKKPWGK